MIARKDKGFFGKSMSQLQLAISVARYFYQNRIELNHSVAKEFCSMIDEDEDLKDFD